MDKSSLDRDSSPVDSILTLLKENMSFCLIGHQNPDADVIGSQLAMSQLITKLDPKKDVSIQNAGPVPRSLLKLKGAEKIKNVSRVEENFDVVIVFECSGEDRMGNIINLKNQAKNVINIDHHLHNPNFGTVNFVEPKTSSTAELIFKIFQRSGIPLQKEEAIALFTGIVADTGWFRYSNTNRQTHEIAAQLVETGVPVSKIAEQLYMSLSKPALKLLAWVLTHMRLIENDRVAVMVLPEDIFQEFNAEGDDTEGIVNYGLQIESVMASIFLKEHKGPPAEVKVSLRSKGDFDINRVARVFGGGGHRNASGCRILGPLPDVEKALLNEFHDRFV